MCAMGGKNWKFKGRGMLLNFFVLHEYGTKFLSMAKEGYEIISIEDIGETAINDELLQDDKEELKNAEIVGIASLEQYKSCLRCKARVEPASRGLGRCSKEECLMLQKFDKCTSHTSAKLLVQSGSINLSLYGHSQMVCDIASVEEINKEILLQAPIIHKVIYK